MKLSRVDRLLLFSDGIREASGPQGQEFGEDGLAAFAKANSTSSAFELNRLVLSHVTDFCGGKFQDDATLLLVAVSDPRRHFPHHLGRDETYSRPPGANWNFFTRSRI